MSARAKPAEKDSKPPSPSVTEFRPPRTPKEDDDDDDEEMIDCAFDRGTPTHPALPKPKTKKIKHAKTQYGPQVQKLSPHPPKTNPEDEEGEDEDEETLQHQPQQQQLPPKGLKNPEKPLLLRLRLSLCHRKTPTELTE